MTNEVVELIYNIILLGNDIRRAFIIIFLVVVFPRQSTSFHRPDFVSAYQKTHQPITQPSSHKFILNKFIFYYTIIYL